MSPDPQIVLAVAVVIDSSLALAQEWPKPVFSYITNTLKRVTDAHAPARLRLAFVGYGTPDTVPSPILSKRFFVEGPKSLNELLEFPHHFGIGTTNSGGRRGMSTLDGLVAALELFDGLPPLPNTKVVGSYIVHFSGAPADNSRKPSWNDNIMMDDLDWESLPIELKKRNIRYNVLSLRPIEGRLSEFYSAMNGNTDPSTPWFDLRPQHTLYAASIAALELKGQHGKRPSEPQAIVDRTPDNKRPRLQGNPDSPKPTPKSTVSQHSSQSSLSQSQTQPPIQPVPKTSVPIQAVATPPQPPKPTPQLTPTSTAIAQPLTNIQVPGPAARIPPTLTSADAYQRLGQLEASIQIVETKHSNARLSQNQDQIEATGRELSQRKELYNKMKTAFDAHFKMNQPQPTAVPNVSTNQQPFPSNPLSGSSIPTTQPPIVNPPPSVPQDIMSTGHGRSLSSAGSIPSTTPSLTPTIPHVPANTQSLSVQMQKMIEQKQRSQQTSPNLTMGGLPPHMQMPAGQAGMDPAFSGPSSVLGAGNMPGPSQAPQPEWNGVLKWSGTAATGKKELQCAVTVNSVMHPQKAYEDTWPSVMVLIPAPEQFPMSDMHDFIKKHQPSVALFKPAVNEADAQNYKSLMALLANKKIYATSSWPNPSGMVTRNIIFFPHTHHSILAGAVFPVTGLPTLPRPVNHGLPTNLPPALASLPPATIHALQAMAPEQRQQFVYRIMQQSMVQQQQAAAAAQLQNQNDTGLSAMPPQPQSGVNNLTTALNIMGPTQGMPSNPTMPGMNAPEMPNTLQNRMPTNAGNVAGNFSYEMMQSFMQRSAGEGGPKT